MVLWFLGYPDQALKRIYAALTLAHELSHPFSLAHTLAFAAMLHQLRREGQATQERAETLIGLSTEQGFSLWLAWGTLYQGWALAEQGQEGGGVQIHRGIAAYRATGAELWRPHFFALLVEVYEKGGQAEKGMIVLTEALTVVEGTGECYYKAELSRLKGELLLTQEIKSQKSKGKRQKSKIPSPQPLTPRPHTEAEACFLKAIEIAQHQQAKSLELRATMSLARLWQQQEKKKQARQLLAEIYGWFTEGFDTKDLQEAKTLLETLVT